SSHATVGRSCLCRQTLVPGNMPDHASPNQSCAGSRPPPPGVFALLLVQLPFVRSPAWPSQRRLAFQLPPVCVALPLVDARPLPPVAVVDRAQPVPELPSGAAALALVSRAGVSPDAALLPEAVARVPPARPGLWLPSRVRSAGFG